MDAKPRYRQLADHYLAAIQAGALSPGDRMPSLRDLKIEHGASLSTVLQACRLLEQQGWLEARPRAGYFVRQPQRRQVAPAREPDAVVAPDPAQYVGIHARVSSVIAAARANPARIQFGFAVGAPELYPAERLKRIGMQVLRRAPERLTSMLPLGGHPPLKAALARRAMEAGFAVAPDEITVTHGCIEALNVALRALASPGDTIAVESPTYFGLLQVLESLGLRVLEIPTSPHTGLSVAALEQALREHGNIKAVVAMPNLHNPLGCVMPDEEKARLVQLCARWDLPLIEDDTYGELTGSSHRLKAAKAWDETGHVLYCSSFTKVLSPGMRIGWLAAGRWQPRVDMFKYAQTRLNDEWPQAVLAEFVGSRAYDAHLRKLRATLAMQRPRMADAIASYFPPGTRFSLPPGGVMLWVELPGRVCSQVVFEEALRIGIRIAPGVMFSNSGRFDHFLRLNCGSPYTPEIDEALRQLGQIVQAQLLMAAA